jgi:hypothetical protein
MCFANWFLGRIVRSVPWLKSLLLETPSGFAVFSIDASLMDKENAVEVRMDAVDRLGFNNSSNFFCPIDDFTYWLLISCFYLCSTFGPTSSRTIWQKILLVHLPPSLSLCVLSNAPCFHVEIVCGCSSFICDEGWLYFDCWDGISWYC